MGKKVLLLLVFSLFFAENFAQIDTSVQFLEGISVEGKAERSAISTTVPVQTLTQADIQTMPAVLLSDVLKLFSGIVIKDYGGVGGMKTVSMRGFGSQHTAISYDGLPVTDCQTGQIDLSKFSLENVEQISVNSGTDDIFLPARLFAAANLIQIRTLRPKFDKRPFHIDFGKCVYIDIRGFGCCFRCCLSGCLFTFRRRRRIIISCFAAAVSAGYY